MKTDDAGNGLCDLCEQAFCNVDSEQIAISGSWLCGDCVRAKLLLLEDLLELGIEVVEYYESGKRGLKWGGDIKARIPHQQMLDGAFERFLQRAKPVIDGKE